MYILSAYEDLMTNVNQILINSLSEFNDVRVCATYTNDVITRFHIHFVQHSLKTAWKFENAVFKSVDITSFKIVKF